MGVLGLVCLVVDVVGGWVEGGLRRGVGWRACVAFPEVLVTHADVLLAPGGRRRLAGAACVVDGGWLLRRVPRLRPPPPGWWVGLLPDRPARDRPF